VLVVSQVPEPPTQNLFAIRSLPTVQAASVLHFCHCQEHIKRSRTRSDGVIL
jgi:hypothetical protein